MKMQSGFFVGEDDLKRVYESNEPPRKFLRPELEKGVVSFNFMGAGVFDYLVTKESVFYPYLEKEGRKEVYVL
jgi:hypothetical protein